MSNISINERVFADLNANPEASIEYLIKGDKRSIVTAVRNCWRKTRHKEYTYSSSVPDPVMTARSILTRATKEGLSEAEGRDLAIDAGVAHGTAFAVAAEVYRDFRREQPKLKRARGTWTVRTESGLELPVCHNIRVGWSQVQRWSREFGPVVKVDCMTKEVIQNEGTIRQSSRPRLRLKRSVRR